MIRRQVKTRVAAARRPPTNQLAHALTTALLGLCVAVPASPVAPSPSPSPRPSKDLDEVLDGYNEKIRADYESVIALRVDQEVLEPRPDGSFRRALAVLSYADGEMTREVISSELRYPAGRYTLRSLIGPELAPLEYSTALEGIEEMEGRECYRIAVTASDRDVDHFDGTVWISIDDLALVRITGEVADPPFPAVRITVDKAFERVSCGLSLLMRHTGEVEVSLGVARRGGKRHIFYYEYQIEQSGAPSPESGKQPLE